MSKIHSYCKSAIAIKLTNLHSSLTRTEGGADCDMMAIVGVLVLGDGVGSVRSGRAGAELGSAASGRSSTSQRRLGTRGLDEGRRSSAVVAEGWGGVTLRRCGRTSCRRRA
jgi:hypothetical protein